MRRLAAVTLAFLALPGTGAAQSAPRASDVVSEDSIIHALYACISGPAGQARDWDRFRSLFVPDARLIPTIHVADRDSLWSWTVEGYINATGQRLMTNGFFERETARTTERFAGIVQ